MALYDDGVDILHAQPGYIELGLCGGVFGISGFMSVDPYRSRCAEPLHVEQYLAFVPVERHYERAPVYTYGQFFRQTRFLPFFCERVWRGALGGLHDARLLPATRHFDGVPLGVVERGFAVAFGQFVVRAEIAEPPLSVQRGVVERRTERGGVGDGCLGVGHEFGS